MGLKRIGFITALFLIMMLGGCNATENSNETANRNANANAANRNANMNANANANANANDNANANANRQTGRAPTREEYERNKEQYQREAKQSGRTVGTGLNDGWLWVKTRFDLAAADDLRDSTINVDVDNAVVSLTGTVATPVQKTKAEQVAKAVDGVKSVKNLLKVAPNTNSNSNTNTGNKNANGNRNR